MHSRFEESLNSKESEHELPPICMMISEPGFHKLLSSAMQFVNNFKVLAPKQLRGSLRFLKQHEI